MAKTRARPRVAAMARARRLYKNDLVRLKRTLLASKLRFGDLGDAENESDSDG